jgi:hypothetical protein
MNAVPLSDDEVERVLHALRSDNDAFDRLMSLIDSCSPSSRRPIVDVASGPRTKSPNLR